MKQNYVLVVIAIFLIGAAAVALTFQKLNTATQPVPQNTPVQSSNDTMTYKRCIADGGSAVPTFAPPAMCEINGKSYTDTSSYNLPSGVTDLASCLDKVNKSDANEQIIEQSRQACYDRYQ